MVNKNINSKLLAVQQGPPTNGDGAPGEVAFGSMVESNQKQIKVNSLGSGGAVRKNKKGKKVIRGGKGVCSNQSQNKNEMYINTGMTSNKPDIFGNNPHKAIDRKSVV